MSRIGETLRATATLVRRIAGMPDYDAYITHLRDKHPECRAPSEREYYAMYLKGRYENGVNRCC